MFVVSYHQLQVAVVVLFVLAHQIQASSDTDTKSNQIKTQLTSPCPDLFQYESLNAEEPGRWYGTFTILNDYELNGVWVRLIFDKAPIEVGLAGNWSGDIVTKDPTDFLVKNPKHIVAADTPYKVRFYVKYNPEETPPKLHSFRLNAKTVCSSDKTTSNEGDFVAACGTVITRPGDATYEAQFPWHVALYHAKGNDLSYTCGATLITRHHLVTAAHCVTQEKSTEPLSVDSLVVYLGKLYRKRWASPEIQAKHIEQIAIHPAYDAGNLNNDIAIIKMASSIKITNYVRPVCLWGDDVQVEKIVDKTGTVVGWGFDKEAKVTEQLAESDMSIVSQEACVRSQPDFYSKFASATTFCAGSKKDASLCIGDSGSGMVFPKSTTSPGGTAWQLRGLVSSSVALKDQTKCDASRYAVFTDVAKYLDWIKDTVN